MEKKIVIGQIIVFFVLMLVSAGYAEEKAETAVSLASESEMTEDTAAEEEEIDRKALQQLKMLEATQNQLESMHKTQRELEEIKRLNELRGERQRAFDAGNTQQVDDLNQKIHAVRQRVHTSDAAPTLNRTEEGRTMSRTEQ